MKVFLYVDLNKPRFANSNLSETSRIVARLTNIDPSQTCNSGYICIMAPNEDSRQSAYLLPLAFSKAPAFMNSG